MTLTDIITSIQVLGSFPSDNYFSNSEYRTIINDAFKTHITPLLMRLNEEYFVVSERVAITSKRKYPIPRRAIGSKLRDVKVVTGSNNFSHLKRLYEEDRGQARSGYYIAKNSIELSSDITSGSLELTYFLRPSNLVSTSECATIVSIDEENNKVVVESLPSTFLVGKACDFVQADSPYDLMDFNLTLVSINGLELEFESVPDDLEVGDYLCLAKTSPVPNVPEELIPVLVQAALVQCLASKKDKAVEYEIAVLDRMKEDVVNLLDPRVESNDSKIRPQGLLSKIRNR